jgi:hypothetical protein
VSKSWIRTFHIYRTKHSAAHWSRQHIVTLIDILRGTLVPQGHQSTAPLPSLHLRAYIKPESKAALGLMQTQSQTLGTFGVLGCRVGTYVGTYLPTYVGAIFGAGSV